MADPRTVIIVRLILENRGKMLFLAQTNQNGGRYSLVGGKVELKEFSTQALCRESLEEAGIEIKPDDLELVHVLHQRKARSRVVILYYKAREWSGAPAAKEPKKFKRAEWFPASDPPKNISGILRQVLKLYKKGVRYSEYSQQKRL